MTDTLPRQGDRHVVEAVTPVPWSRFVDRVSSRLPIEVRWPSWAANASLQRRLVLLITFAVASGVVLSGVAAYAMTRMTLYRQLDRELIDVASVTATRISGDVDSGGGLNVDALQAANVALVIIESNKAETRIPGDTVSLVVGPDELAVARTGLGSSARTGMSSDGGAYRIVAVPIPDTTGNYALVLGRDLGPTLATLSNLGWTTAFVGALGVVLSAISGWAVSRSTLRPIRQLNNAVAYITETNELVPIETDGDDEIADLGRSFNSMVYSLASSRERQQRLIADAGHELRTPLTSLRTNIELLIADERAGMLPEGARSEILRDIAAQLGEFTALVGDLVHLTREGAEARQRELDFAEVVDNAISRAKRRGPSLMFDVSLEPVMVLGEADSLERAVTNLLDNAVKFSPHGGTIRVRLHDDQLVISDEGPGIAEEDLPHIFDRFYRSDRARNTPGTGLGLSIVAHTINSHGGWVKAGRSEAGGAEFTVHLPVLVGEDDSQDGRREDD